MKRSDNSPARVIAILVLLLLLVFVVYPLSFGPMFWICSDAGNRVGHDGKSRAFLAVYHPVIWVYQKGPEPMRELLGRYLDFWEK